MRAGKPPAGDTTSASVAIGSQERLVSMGLAATDLRQAIEAEINSAVRPGGRPLQAQLVELHLIRALSTVDLGQGPELIVSFPPEFRYVANVGMRARAGVSVFWDSGAGAGDPKFPDFSTARLRSISGTDPSALVYPAVAGELLIGVDPSRPQGEVNAELVAFGLWSIRFSGGLAEARCEPFQESDICVALTREFDFIRFAESNRVIRRGEMVPGWSVTRIF